MLSKLFEGGVIDKVEALYRNEEKINNVTVMISIGCLLILFLFDYARRNYHPKSLLLQCGALFVAISGSIIVYFFDMEKLYNVQLLGSI